MKKTTQRIIIAVSVIAVIGLFVFFLKDILIPYIKLEIANDLDGARDLLASKGILGFLTVMLVEALQMVVIFIPAEFIQISSGMSYPFYIAILLCDLGVCLGATIIYVLVRVFRFSNDAYKKNEEFIDRIEQQSAKKHRSTVLLMYFLFIMPIVPFGAICYYGSGRKLHYPRYILTVATGVIPSIITSNLMGAATKFFIGNDLPLWLLVLIIIGLGAILLISLILFLDKVCFKENDGTPDSVVYSVLFRLVKMLHGRKVRLHFDDALIRDLEAPYIILANHESFYDFYYVRSLIKNNNPAIIANRHIITKPVIRKLAKKMGFIPKRLFVPDLAAPMGIMRTLKKGYSVMIFPEGRLSIVGREYPIVERSADFYKKLKCPIVLVNIRGAFFANPKWRKRVFRSDIFVSAVRVITKDELDILSADELKSIIDNSLKYDESEECVNRYPQKEKAVRLENVLYRCADCGALYSTKGVGNEFRCSACGSVRTINDEYRFTDGSSIGEYYQRIIEAEKAELDDLRLETDVRTVIYSEKGRYKTKEKGKCILTKSEFSYVSVANSFSVPLDQIPALAFSCNAEFETYHDERLFYFYPSENKRQCARWALIVDLVKELADEKE